MSESAHDRQLQAIARLEAQATPSEKTYLQQQREKAERRKAQAASSPEETQNTESMAANVDQGFQALYRYQFEHSKPDLDPLWQSWVEERIKQTEGALGPLLQELKDAGYAYTPPLYDPVKLQRVVDLEEVRSRLVELETMARLKLAWGERTGKVEAVQNELSELHRQIIALQFQLTDLEASSG